MVDCRVTDQKVAEAVLKLKQMDEADGKLDGKGRFGKLESGKEADLSEKLLELDRLDGGKNDGLDGSIFTNKLVRQYLDMVDNGKEDGSFENYIHFLTNAPGEEPDPTRVRGGYSVFDILAKLTKELEAVTRDLPVYNQNVTYAAPSKGFGAVGENATNMDSVGSSSPTGTKLAQAAAAVSSPNSRGGGCYGAVAKAVVKATGLQLSGKSAYMAADQLASSDKFVEIKVSKEQLPSLPAGAVVVWDRGKGHVHGHISVASGNGTEFSDKDRKQITSYGTNFRVFVPKDMARGMTAVA